MSAWDMAAVAGGVAAAVAVAVVLARLLVAVTSLDRTTRELVRAIDDVRQTVPRANGAVAVGPDGNGDAVLDAASSDGRAAGHARLRPFDLGLASPVIKARALGRGTSEAARQLRQRREG